MSLLSQNSGDIFCLNYLYPRIRFKGLSKIVNSKYNASKYGCIKWILYQVFSGIIRNLFYKDRQHYGYEFCEIPPILVRTN